VDHRRAIALKCACESQRYAKKSLPYSIPPEQLPVLEQLTAELREHMQPLLADGGGVFVRLSKRSPKDASLDDPDLKQKFIEEVKKVEELGVGPEGEFRVKGDVAYLIALVRVVTDVLCVRSAEQAMEIISKSDRVFTDLTLDMLQQEEDYACNIILRRFDTSLRPEMEFRAFVNDRRMTAVTQYNSSCFSPEIVAHKSQIAELMHNYYEEEVKDRLPYDSYVIDFVIRKDGKPFVIELNPFGRCTHAGLFDWTKDEEVLKGGKPFEFRILEEPLEDPTATLAGSLKQMLQEVRHEHKSHCMMC